MSAKEILARVEGGEPVGTSTVHLSEVVNVVEKINDIPTALGFLQWILNTSSIYVFPVTVEDYQRALTVAARVGVGANDALAYTLMKHEDIQEIYSMDHHFDFLPDIKRLPETPRKE